jgi:hypothetical protein
MRTLIGLLAIAVIVANSESASAADKCDFSMNSIDDATGERVIQTEFDKVITSMSFAPSEATGAISILSKGGQKYLAIKFEAIDHFPLPSDIAAVEDPNWHPDYLAFHDSLLGDTAIYPQGSTVRLDLDDQTSISLAMEQHRRVRTHYAEPGGSVSSRNSSTKTAKKLVGFLAKMASADVSTDGDASRYHSVGTNTVLQYPIDAESEELLKRALVVGMRVEARDRYYVMGYKTTRGFVGWSDKSYEKIRNAINCVADAAER